MKVPSITTPSITDMKALNAEISAYLILKKSMAPMQRAIEKIETPPKGVVSGDWITFETK